MGSLKLEDLPHYTYEDYEKWEDNWELIYGIPYSMSPAPIIKHQNISNKIAHQLYDLFKDCKECQVLLPVDWKIAKDTIVQPDNSYYTSLERIAKVKGTSIYPYLSNNMAVNRSEGLKLCPVDSTQEIKTDKVEAIKPIGEDDDCYA